MLMQPVRGADVGARLLRSLLADARAAGLPLQVVAIEGRRWASATFEGMRHLVTIAHGDAARLRDWLAVLPERDLPVPGHVVAELAVEACDNVGDAVQARLAVLTLAAD